MKVPQTSLDAYKQVHENMRSSHYGKIMSAMRILSIPSSMEAIASKAGMSVAQVSRRIGELVTESIVKIDGEGLTSSKRRCNLYVLTKQGEKTHQENPAMPKVVYGTSFFVQREMF